MSSEEAPKANGAVPDGLVVRREASKQSELEDEGIESDEEEVKKTKTAQPRPSVSFTSTCGVWSSPSDSVCGVSAVSTCEK